MRPCQCGVSGQCSTSFKAMTATPSRPLMAAHPRAPATVASERRAAPYPRPASSTVEWDFSFGGSVLVRRRARVGARSWRPRFPVHIVEATGRPSV